MGLSVEDLGIGFGVKKAGNVEFPTTGAVC